MAAQKKASFLTFIILLASPPQQFQEVVAAKKEISGANMDTTKIQKTETKLQELSVTEGIKVENTEAARNKAAVVFQQSLPNKLDDDLKFQPNNIDRIFPFKNQSESNMGTKKETAELEALQPTTETALKGETGPTAETAVASKIEPIKVTVVKAEILQSTETAVNKKIEPISETAMNAEMKPTTKTTAKTEIEPSTGTTLRTEIQPTSETVMNVEIEPTTVTEAKIELEPTMETLVKTKMELASGTIVKAESEPTTKTESELTTSIAMNTERELSTATAVKAKIDRAIKTGGKFNLTLNNTAVLLHQDLFDGLNGKFGFQPIKSYATTPLFVNEAGSNMKTTTKIEIEPTTEATVKTEMESSTEAAVAIETEKTTSTATKADIESTTKIAVDNEREPSTKTAMKVEIEPNTETTTTTTTEETTRKTSDIESCIDLDIRLCLTKECVWYHAKCVHRIALNGTKSPFPVLLPENIEHVYEIFNLMWENPPSYGDRRFWLGFLVCSIVIGNLSAIVTLGMFTFWLFRKILSCCSSRDCNNKKYKEGPKKCRGILITPNRTHDLDSCVVDYHGNTLFAKRIPDRDGANDCQTSMCSVASGESSWPTVVMNDDEIENTSSIWPYDSKSIASSSCTVTAIADRKRMATKSSSLSMEGGYSGNNSESGSCTKYINPAFSVSSFETENSLKHVVATDDKWKHFSDTFDEENCYQEIHEVVKNPVPLVMEETVKESTSTINTGSGKDLPWGVSTFDTRFNKKNASKLEGFISKLKKVGPPQVSAQASKDMTMGMNKKEEGKTSM